MQGAEAHGSLCTFEGSLVYIVKQDYTMNRKTYRAVDVAQWQGPFLECMSHKYKSSSIQK